MDQTTGDEEANRLELLLFTLHQGGQRFAIPVSGVREVREGLTATPLPNAHPLVMGLVQLRGNTFPLFDLEAALGAHGASTPARHDGPIIVTEQGHSLQGVMVRSVERIAVVDRREVMAAPPGSGRHHLIGGVVHIDDTLVELLDLKAILGEAVGSLGEASG
ncbi:chemotaxis protein CheW [Endothiovibrio diazotrophicus]